MDRNAFMVAMENLGYSSELSDSGGSTVIIFKRASQLGPLMLVIDNDSLSDPTVSELLMDSLLGMDLDHDLWTWGSRSLGVSDGG
jgi:hypothetical protein